MFDLEYILDIVKKNILAIVSIVFGVVCLVLAGGIYYYYNFQLTDEKKEIVNFPTNENEEIEVSQEVMKVKVDVKGAVKNAGVYELESGSNIQDAIKMAGGITSKASTKNINLAKKLTDEMVIYVFTKTELEKQESKNEVVCEIPKCECETVVVNECPTIDETLIENSTIQNDQNDQNVTKDKISINTATIAELTTLDGIGESKAKAIVEYREINGSFKKIEDIMNVSGIGEAAFEKIKNNITI